MDPIAPILRSVWLVRDAQILNGTGICRRFSGGQMLGYLPQRFTVL